jgi:hypothetical protein
MCLICDKDLDDLKKLDTLVLENCNDITTIPKELCDLKSLKISKCYNFTTIPKELVNLELLYIHYYNRIPYIPLEFVKLQELQFDYHYDTKQSASYYYSWKSNEIKQILHYIYNQVKKN